MTHKYLVIDATGLVVNEVVIDDGVWSPPEGCTAVPSVTGVGIGHMKVGDNWVEPATPDNTEYVILDQIEELRARFTPEMQMRITLGDQSAIDETQELLTQIEALKALLV